MIHKCKSNSNSDSNKNSMTWIFLPPRSPGTSPQTSPGTPVASSPVRQLSTSKKLRPRLVDPPSRLQFYKKHVPVTITIAVGTSKFPQKRCRVCYINGIRRDTTKQCALCNIPLCVKGPCFEDYHKKAKYWQSPPDVRGRRGRRGVRQ